MPTLWLNFSFRFCVRAAWFLFVTIVLCWDSFIQLPPKKIRTSSSTTCVFMASYPMPLCFTSIHMILWRKNSVLMRESWSQIRGPLYWPRWSTVPTFFAIVTWSWRPLFVVSNKVFGLILSAYVDGLFATIEKSKDRAKNNDVSSSMVHFCNTYRWIRSFRS